MSKTDADVRRREQGTIIKPIRKIKQTMIDEVIDGGCPWYGNIELMKDLCPKCERRECY